MAAEGRSWRAAGLNWCTTGLVEVHRHPPRLVARQPIWSPSGATQRYVRNRGRTEVRGLRLNDVDDPEVTSGQRDRLDGDLGDSQ